MSTKPIRLSGHARGNLTFRGTTEEEITEAIRTATWEPAELGRLGCRKDFAYEREWNGKFYETNKSGQSLSKRPMRLWS